MNAKQFALDRQIDPNQLDVAALEQADLFFKYAEQYSHARVELDRAKALLDLTEARIGFKCREKPEAFGLTKATEAAIKEVIKCDEEYKLAMEAYLDRKVTCLILEQATQAMEQRKRMLEILVTLHGQEYFAGPHIKRDLAVAYSERQSERSNEVTDKQRSRVRTSVAGKKKGRKSSE